MSNASAPDPDLEIFGSRYYVYATSGSDGVLPIFVSDTASIRGGFRQPGASQDHRQRRHGLEAIDPTTYAGAGNKLYLVWRRGHYTTGFPYGAFQIKARQITIATRNGKPRITLAAGAALQLAQVTGNAPVMEAPSMLYRNNRLWLFVARGAFNDYKVPYRTDVWSAAGITGTFRERRTVLAGGEGWGTGPGSASVIAHGGIVYIAYHAWQGSTRVTRFARLVWQGGIPVAEPLPASASA
jgi:hypothetical protein